MKKYIIILTAILFVAVSAIFVSAEDYPYLVDNQGVFTEDEYTALYGILEQESRENGLDIVVVTTPSLEGKTATEYADDFYDYNGYRKDGILLLLCLSDIPGESEWATSTSGEAEWGIDDDELYSIEDEMLYYFGDRDFFRGCKAFAEKSAEYYAYYTKNGVRYFYTEPVEPKFNAKGTAIGSVIFGAIVSLISNSKEKKKLSSVSHNTYANTYVNDGSFSVTNAADVFLYSNVSRVRRDTDTSRSGGGGSSHHISSSGSSHGGHSGRF